MLGMVPTPMVAKFLGARRKGGRFQPFVYNPDNIERSVQREMMNRVTSPLYRGEMDQFDPILASGDFTSCDGEICYQDALWDTGVPTLFFAGRMDRIASPDRVRAYYDAMPTDDKQFLVLSEANGYHADYGHCDFGVADNVRDEVFEPIVGWLRSHPPGGEDE